MSTTCKASMRARGGSTPKRRGGSPLSTQRQNFLSGIVGLGLGSEVVFDVFPVVAPLVIGAQRAARIIAAMDHAVLAASVTGHPVHHPVFAPVHLVEHLLVAGIMAIGIAFLTVGLQSLKAALNNPVKSLRSE